MSELARAEYIEVEPNVRLHITDAGDGRPVVLNYNHHEQSIKRSTFRIWSLEIRRWVLRYYCSISGYLVFAWEMQLKPDI